jgi:hypothetical protein
VYSVFKAMLDRGNPPATIEQLLTACREM